MNKLLAKDTPRNIINSSSDQLYQLGLTNKQLQAWASADKEVDACLMWLATSTNHHILTLADPLYPLYSSKLSLRLRCYLSRGILPFIATTNSHGG